MNSFKTIKQTETECHIKKKIHWNDLKKPTQKDAELRKKNIKKDTHGTAHQKMAKIKDKKMAKDERKSATNEQKKRSMAMRKEDKYFEKIYLKRYNRRKEDLEPTQ